MNNMMKYKGYYGSVEYDEQEPIFHGKLAFIQAVVVSYEATDATGIKKAFQEAVDDYLALCQQEGITPETPFKGSLNVRLGHELHERVALAALASHVSINRYICGLLEKNIHG